MVSTLAGRVALVSGGNRGIGRAVAIGLAKAGADVVVNYHSHEDEAERVADEVRAEGGRSLCVRADVADLAAVEEMVARTVASLGAVGRGGIEFGL